MDIIVKNIILNLKDKKQSDVEDEKKEEYHFDNMDENNGQLVQRRHATIKSKECALSLFHCVESNNVAINFFYLVTIFKIQITLFCLAMCYVSYMACDHFVCHLNLLVAHMMFWTILFYIPVLSQN